MSQDSDYVTHSKSININHIDISSSLFFLIISFIEFLSLENSLIIIIYFKLFQEYSLNNDNKKEENNNYLSNINFVENCFIDCDSNRYWEKDNEKWILRIKNYYKVFLLIWIWFWDS